MHAVERRADGWHAKVSGSGDYAASIPASLDPHRAQCTCPHYADGNICKHIAAVLIAVARQQEAGRKSQRDKAGNEPIEEIVMCVSADDLSAFVLDALRYDEALERELRATFGTRDVRQAKRELQKATTALMRRYERGSFIDWRGAL